MPEGVRRRRPGWWVAPVYLAMGCVLAPWTADLAWTLPSRVVTHHYRLAWVGFDLLLMLSMVRTAWLAWQRSPFVVNVASATAALLVVDAWFDVTTASRAQLPQALLLALVVEMPAALLSLLIAGRAQVQLSRSGAVPADSVLWRLAERSEELDGTADDLAEGAGEDAAEDPDGRGADDGRTQDKDARSTR